MISSLFVPQPLWSIFAHGTHELRAAKRKQDRQKMRPPLKKFMIGLLNKLCEGNYEQVITEFMTVCLEVKLMITMSKGGGAVWSPPSFLADFTTDYWLTKGDT